MKYRHYVYEIKFPDGSYYIGQDMTNDKFGYLDSPSKSVWERIYEANNRNGNIKLNEPLQITKTVLWQSDEIDSTRNSVADILKDKAKVKQETTEQEHEYIMKYREKYGWDKVCNLPRL